MTIIATDTFTRVDNADLGTDWTPNLDSMRVVSNAAQPRLDSNDAFERWITNAFPNDQYSQAVLNSVAAGGVGAGSGVGVRWDTGGANTGYRLAGNSSGYELARFNGGVTTSLSSGSGTTFANGNTIYLEIVGAVWNCKKNGVSFASGTDSSPIASGSAGIGYSSTSSPNAIDTWEGGSLAAADIISPSYPDSVNEYEAVEVNLVDNAAYDFYGSSPLSSNDDVVTSHESFPDTTDEPEWTDEALYPHYWSHAPPPADVWDPPSDNFVIDPYNYDDQDEPFGFTDAPLAANIAADIIAGEDSDGQLEDEEEPFGFYDAPLSANDDALYVEDGDCQLEDVDEDYGFADGQNSDDLPQQGIYEDGQYSDPEDEPFDFYDAQVPANDLPQQALLEDGQYFDPEDEPFDFQSGPLSDDGPSDQVGSEDGSDQLEEYLDEDFGFSDVQNEDFVPVDDQIYPELADDQLEDVDEPFDFYDGQIPDDVVDVPVVVQPFVIGGGWIPLHKKKKKKKRPVVEFEHVVIIPQETPDLDDKRIYRYVGDLSSELKNIRLQMVEARDALEIAVRENKRIRNDEELLILLSI